MPHIGIIGAGVAGLRCADVLLQHGFRVTILEGRNRVGGRVNQVLLPNTKFSIDTGANWIHGTDHNPILDLAKQTGTATHSWGEKINDFDEDGKHILEKTAVEYNEIFWGIIADAFAHSHKNGPSRRK
jgi:phytoene dehydrogenase-like protein